MSLDFSVIRAIVTKRRGRPRHSAHSVRQRHERAADLYLRDCYARRSPARLTEYAQYLEMTHQHLARSAPALGMSLRAFLRSRQLAYAEHLLLTTLYTTSEIAVMSAFGTRPAFYRAFKAAYGMPPGQYRLKVQK